MSSESKTDVWLESCARLTDANGNVFVGATAERLSDEQKARYVASSGRMGLEALTVLTEDGTTALIVTGGEQDHIAVLKPGASQAELLLVDDGISYEQLSPLQLVEYSFEKADGSVGEWMVSNIGAETLAAYSGSKFSIWRNNMLNAFGGCAAAFLPDIKRGYAMSNVYDHMIFCSPAAEKADWETTHNGKIVSIPRPVHALRVWNSETHEYVELDPHMPGAPNNKDPTERSEYWTQFLDELRSTLNPKYGEDFINDCLSLDPAEVKQKYGF